MFLTYKTNTNSNTNNIIQIMQKTYDNSITPPKHKLKQRRFTNTPPKSKCNRALFPSSDKKTENITDKRGRSRSRTPLKELSSLSCKAKIDSQARLQALVENNNLKQLDELAELYDKEIAIHPDAQHISNLMMTRAAQLGHEEIACFFLTRDIVDPNFINDKGQSIINLGIEKDLTYFVKALLSAKCDPNKQDNFGKLPLHFAVENGKLKFVKILLENKYSPVVPDNEDRDKRNAYWYILKPTKSDKTIKLLNTLLYPIRKESARKKESVEKENQAKLAELQKYINSNDNMGIDVTSYVEEAHQNSSQGKLDGLTRQTLHAKILSTKVKGASPTQLIPLGISACIQEMMKTDTIYWQNDLRVNAKNGGLYEGAMFTVTAVSGDNYPAQDKTISNPISPAPKDPLVQFDRGHTSAYSLGGPVTNSAKTVWRDHWANIAVDGFMEKQALAMTRSGEYVGVLLASIDTKDTTTILVIAQNKHNNQWEQIAVNYKRR